MKFFHSTKTFHLFFLFSLILFRVYSGFCMVLGVLSCALTSGNGCNIVLCKGSVWEVVLVGGRCIYAYNLMLFSFKECIFVLL